jgi:hypothetical protein
MQSWISDRELRILPTQSAIRNPQSAIPTIRNPQSDIRNPNNPQSEIRNPKSQRIADRELGSEGGA